jgi:hypothetical protein
VEEAVRDQEVGEGRCAWERIRPSGAVGSGSETFLPAYSLEIISQISQPFSSVFLS